VDSLDSPSWPPRPIKGANSKKDLVTGQIGVFVPYRIPVAWLGKNSAHFAAQRLGAGPSSRWSSTDRQCLSNRDRARDKERCSAESSERSSLATTPEPRRDRLGSLPTPRPRFPPPSTPTVGHLLAPGQTHSRNLSLCLIGGREIKGVWVAWPMRRTARRVSDGDLSGCPTSRMGGRARSEPPSDAPARAWSEFDPLPPLLPRVEADDLLTGDVREFPSEPVDANAAAGPGPAPSPDQASASEGAGAPST
jgi:hypothetical protein